VREVEDGRGDPKQAELAEKQIYEGEAEKIGSHTQFSECRASSQIMNSEEDEEDEEDKEPWPTKQQKRNWQLTHQTLVQIE
jgi:hypothetical protein